MATGKAEKPSHLCSSQLTRLIACKRKLFIHAAMPDDGKVLIIETVVPAGNEPHYSKVLDLEMLVSPGGLERTAEEYRELLAAAGLRLTRIIPMPSPYSIVEAVKAR